MPLEGQQLGRYRLLRLLGSGGMGEVYLAEDARIAQQVAIKVIRSEGIDYPGSESAKDAARLFEREARAIARLDHPNILPLYAYGEETINEMLLTYLVMPYRKEGTLATWLRQRGSAGLLSPAEVAPLLQQAADALQHAHDQQVIHQDIKPTNFLIRMRKDQSNRPDVLLADFGIAKLTSATASASQSIRGTPTYMAPEQWDGHPVPATDQYALAIMVYELLVGRPPFQGGLGQVMRQHYQMPPPTPSTLNARLSPAIDAVLLRALSKEPGERFASVAAFALAFQEAAQSSGELHATLAISKAEAITGTRRSLTLPGGRHVSVTVPAGVADGALLRLEGQGLPYYEGGPAGPLLLTIAIPSAEVSSPPRHDSVEPTFSVQAPNPSRQTPSVEETRMPAARSDAQSVREQTMPESDESRYAPTTFAASKLSVPPEGARSSTPPALRPDVVIPVKPAKHSTSQRLVLLVLFGDLLRMYDDAKSSTSQRLVLVGLVIVTVASGIAWFTLSHAPPTRIITEFAIPTSCSPVPYICTSGITAGPDGNLWFTETNNNKVGRITLNGSITEFAPPTPKSAPLNIAVGPDSNLWFTEFGSNHIGRISTSGTITEFPIPTSRSGPNGIAIGPDGNLWFTEALSNQIGRISISGTVTEFPIPTSGSNPQSIIAGSDGNLWFTEYGVDKIGRITLSGSITEFPIPTSGSNPQSITAGSDGNLWFTEQATNKIGRISTSGTTTEFPNPTSGGGTLGGITAGPDGNLWFTDWGNMIGRISSSGTITEFPIPTSGSSPVGITVGSDGNLWFTESSTNKIGRLTISK